MIPILQLLLPVLFLAARCQNDMASTTNDPVVVYSVSYKEGYQVYGNYGSLLGGLVLYISGLGFDEMP